MATSKGTPMNEAVKDGADNAQGGTTGMLKWLWLSLVVIVLDQITKWVIVFQLEHGEVVPVIPTFNLTHVYNPGAAWSFLANAGGLLELVIICSHSLLHFDGIHAPWF